VITLASTAKHLLRSLKTFHESMHARIGHAEGSQRQGAGSGRCVAAAHQVNVGAWDTHNQCHDVLGELQRDQVKLPKLYRCCFVSSLRVTYLTASKTVRLCSLWQGASFSRGITDEGATWPSSFRARLSAVA
jgi:hypothetical protein